MPSFVLRHVESARRARRSVRARIPRPDRFARPLFGGAIVWPLATLVAGCSSGSKVPVVPAPSLASTPAAQRAYRRIESRWIDLPPDRRSELERPLRVFLSMFDSDDRARTARLYLAVIDIGHGGFSEAHSLVRQVQSGPPGAVRDFANVVEAALLRREGKLMDALALLEPLRGKIADATQRSVYSEELVRALVAARAFEQAIRAMLDWAEQTPQVEREQVIVAIEGLIRGMPMAAIEAGLRTLGDEERAEPSGQRSTRAEARRWLLTTARARLVRVALTERDPELARRLVESSPVRIGHDEGRDALSALAATSLVSPRVAGRAVGVVLDVVDEVSRRRSAEVVEGMTRALGLPARASDEAAIHLVTRDASEQGDIERALAGLAGDGATILVAGVTDDASIAASLFAERAQVPVIVLSRPSGLRDKLRFTFALGAPASAEEAAIAEALVSVSAHAAFRVGPGGAPCGAAETALGRTHFPTEEWKRGGIDTLVLLGDAQCTRDAGAEAVSAGLSPLFVLGLESGETEGAVQGRKLVVASGRFPFGARPLARDERAYIDRWGSAPSWYAALGHDSAVLAAAALSDFPLDRVDDKGAVVGLHWRAQGRLLHARAPLWSTVTPGFEGTNVISREVRAVAPGGAGYGSP